MKNLKKSSIIFTILSFLTLFTSANADIKVVASIKPIHSLVSYLMDGVAKPDLIVDGYASPHGFAMKPSHAKMLQNADIVFWVGEDLENFLEKPLNSIAKKADKIELMDAKGIVKLKFRERNIFGDHDDHDDHDDHGHKKKDDHDDHGHKKKDDQMITMITIMTTMLKKRMVMTTTMIMMDTKDTTMVNLIHTFG